MELLRLRKFFIMSGMPLCFCYFLLCFLAALLHGERMPNVLFIAIDDLKPTLSNYGDRMVHSPNFERLAAQGITFTNAHCQQAVCGPSRASVMTGLRPDRTRIWDLKTKIRDESPDVITIPQHFKAHGYTAVGVGKIFDFRSVEGHVRDDPASWSRPYVQFATNPDEEFGLLNPEFVARVRAKRAELQGVEGAESVREAIGGSPAYEGTEDVEDGAYDDGQIANTAIALIEEFAPAEAPFFVAVGFKKPHLPFIAPKRYWDLYSPDQFTPNPLRERPIGSPEYHFQPGWELRNGGYSDIPLLSDPSPIPDEIAVTLIHGYYACVSYVDAQLGKILDALEASGEADNTIIVLWGDHGYHLGDHGMWCKHTNYEQATRVPFMIIDPRNPDNIDGGKTPTPVELVDTFATLCDLAGIEAPTGIEGVSLKPILSHANKQVKPFAVSQFPRYVGDHEIMGYSWRGPRYRYIEWEDTRFREGGTQGSVIDIELYDYYVDPKETRNLATDPDYADVLDDLQREASIYKYVERADTEAGKASRPDWLAVADVSTAVDPTAEMVWREPDELITYASRPEGDLQLHVFKPEGWQAGDQRAAMVAFHGGGWNSGDPRAFYWQANYLATRGMVVICPQYRIKNVHGTTPIESTRDAMQAMQYVRAHAAELGIDPNRIASAGGSAGGHLAAALATVSGFESEEEGLEGVSPRPDAMVLFNPVLDTTSKGYGNRAIPGDSSLISPINQMAGAQPPTIIFNGDCDTTTAAERSMAFAERMHALGNHCELVLYPGEHHSFFHKGGHPQNFADTLTRTAAFLERIHFLD
jgi:arylsulfatase A-like enzyme/dienelactone hydrolase